MGTLLCTLFILFIGCIILLAASGHLDAEKINNIDLQETLISGWPLSWRHDPEHYINWRLNIGSDAYCKWSNILHAEKEKQGLTPKHSRLKYKDLERIWKKFRIDYYKENKMWPRDSVYQRLNN